MSKYISMYQQLDGPELSYPGGKTRSLDCDVAVLGGGGSGMVAAVRAAEAGASVIVVEKMDVIGGNSRLAGGLLSTYSRFQKDMGMPDKTNDYIKTAYRHNKYTLDPSIFRRYISNTGQFLEWLADHGFDMSNTRWAMDAVCLIKDRAEPGPWNNPAYGPGLMGSSIVNLMIRHARKLGVNIFLQTKVRKLLTDENGAISGLVADGQTDSLNINAKAVIIATGGFGGSDEMLKKYLPHYFSSNSYISHYGLNSMTGDGIKMADAIGAKTGENISVAVHPLAHIPGYYTMQRVISEPIGTIVNKNGLRFISEDDTGTADEAVDIQPEGLAYYLLDSDGMAEAKELVIKHVRFGDRVPEFEEFDKDIATEIAEGIMCRADSLEELAAYIGCAASALQKTVYNCNHRCEAGFDNELFKASEHLRPIKKAPYFAIRLQRNFDVTMGGVSVNSSTQVLRPDGAVIPGLYATGDTASGWMGKDYGPVFSSFAWAMNSGYIAGSEAAKNL